MNKMYFLFRELGLDRGNIIGGCGTMILKLCSVDLICVFETEGPKVEELLKVSSGPRDL